MEFDYTVLRLRDDTPTILVQYTPTSEETSPVIKQVYFDMGLFNAAELTTDKTRVMEDAIIQQAPYEQWSQEVVLKAAGVKDFVMGGRRVTLEEAAAKNPSAAKRQAANRRGNRNGEEEPI